jgi:hypothetical protein
VPPHQILLFVNVDWIDNEHAKNHVFDRATMVNKKQARTQLLLQKSTPILVNTTYSPAAQERLVG